MNISDLTNNRLRELAEALKKRQASKLLNEILKHNGVIYDCHDTNNSVNHSGEKAESG